MSEPLSMTETATCHCAKPIGDCDCIEARVHAAEMTAGFNLRWKADMRAIKRWQAATGRELVWPDHADLVVWLLEQLEVAERSPREGGLDPQSLADAFNTERGSREFMYADEAARIVKRLEATRD